MPYNRTSLLRSPMGLDKSDLSGEVTILQGANVPFFAIWIAILGLNKRDRNGEVSLLVR